MPDRRYPAGNVFYRKLSKTYPVIVRGEGCWLWDEEGRPYLDACGGAFVANLVPVTLGNVVGGTVLVAGVYWLVYLRPRHG